MIKDMYCDHYLFTGIRICEKDYIHSYSTVNIYYTVIFKYIKANTSYRMKATTIRERNLFFV